MIKKPIIITIILLLNSLPLTAQELNAEQIYEKYKDAVVIIKSYGFDGKVRGQGSGIIISDSGYVVTNYHNFDQSERIVVEHFGKQYSGDLILGADVIRDLLIIKLKGNHFPSIKQTDLSKLRVGQKIFTIGSPLGFENTLSEGIISKIGYYPQFDRNFIQLTAPISHGSSGGAVINSQGELVGISSYGIDNGQNINFAIPIDEIKHVNLVSIKDERSIKLLNLYYRGINAQNAAEYSKSVRIFKEFILLYSNFAPIYYCIGLAYEYLEELDSAITYFELTINKDPKFAKAYSELGLINTSLGNYIKAENLYNEAIRLNPQLSNAYINMGGMYLYKKEYDKAIIYCQKALTLNKYHDGTYNNLAIAYESKKEYDKAIDCIKSALIFNPNSYLCYYTLGGIYFAMSDYYEAIDNYLIAIKLKNNFIKAIVDLGGANLRLENYDNAIYYLKQAFHLYEKTNKQDNIKNQFDVEKDFGTSDLINAYYGLGLANYKKNNFDEAINFYRKGLKIDSGYAAYYACLGMAYHQKKDTTNALLNYKLAVEKDSTWWVCYFDMGNIYFDRNNYPTAAENYLKYLANYDKDTTALYKLSFAYYSLNKLDSSTYYLEKLVKIDTTYSEAYNLLGSIYSKSRNFDLAVKYYLKAIKYNSQNGGFYYNLGMTYIESGNKAEAIPYFQKSAQLGYKPAELWLSKNN